MPFVRRLGPAKQDWLEEWEVKAYTDKGQGGKCNSSEIKFKFCLSLQELGQKKDTDSDQEYDQEKKKKNMIRRQRLNKVKLRGTSYGVWVQNQKNHEVHFLKLNSKCKVGSWVRSEIRSNRWETVFKLRGTGSDTQGSFRGNQRVACSGRKPNTWTSLWEESGNRPWGASGIRGSLWLFLISTCTHQKLVVDRVQVLMGTDQIGVFAVKPKLVFAAVKIIQATHLNLSFSLRLCRCD